jgi:SAM-dependent methyltransferase
LADQSCNKQSPRFCDYEDSHYRTTFWEGQGREYEDLAERIALRKLLPPTGERIIDIGGGFGRLVNLYAGYKEIVLLDYSTSQLEDARRRLGDGRITYVAANLYEMPFGKGAFDTAVMVRVLHHQSDVPAALRAIRSILRPGATFVLEYANKRHLKAILRHLLQRQAHNPFDYEPWEFAELNFDFHPRYVERNLKETGFHVERQLCTSHFRIAFLKRIVPASVLATVDGWLQQPTARLQLTPSIFLRARTSGQQTVPVAPEMFCCPRCGTSALVLDADTLGCGGCGRRWSTAGGIYDFRRPLD